MILHPRTFRWLLFVLALIHGAIYIAVIPPWQAPDEVAHFEHAELIATLNRPVSPADLSLPLEHDIIQSLYQFHAWSYLQKQTPLVTPERLAITPFGYFPTLDRFSLSYVVFALAVKPFLRQGILFQLYVMRVVSAIMGAWVVVLAFEITRRALPQQGSLAIAVAAFVLFLPQHGFITASVSDGNLAELAASACLYGIVVLWTDGLSWRWSAACVGCALIAVMSKATTYYLVPLLLVAGPAVALRWNAQRFINKSGIGRSVGLVGLVVGGLGAVLGAIVIWLPPLNFILENIRLNADKLAHFGTYLLTLNSTNRISIALAGTFDSFWATFGWMLVAFPPPVYGILLTLSLVSLAGLAWQLYRQPDFARQARPILPVFGLAALLAFAVLISWWLLSPIGVTYYQGRYLFGAIIPISILLVVGWMALIPLRYQPIAAVLFTIGMGLFDIAALFGLAWPYFYRAGIV